jgi:hypothetical protein
MFAVLHEISLVNAAVFLDEQAFSIVLVLSPFSFVADSLSIGHLASAFFHSVFELPTVLLTCVGKQFTVTFRLTCNKRAFVLVTVLVFY